MIIGITGTLGAGKGTVVTYLIERGFAHYSSSGLLVEILEERGEQIDRDSMARTARELRALDPAGVPKKNYARANLKKGVDAIFESLHTPKEALFIKSVGGFILAVDADIETRYKRVVIRGSAKDNISYEKFLEQTKREELEDETATGHGIRGTMRLADFTLQNDGSVEELYAQIDEALKKFSTLK